MPILMLKSKCDAHLARRVGEHTNVRQPSVSVRLLEESEGSRVRLYQQARPTQVTLQKNSFAHEKAINSANFYEITGRLKGKPPSLPIYMFWPQQIIFFFSSLVFWVANHDL